MTAADQTPGLNARDYYEGSAALDADVREREAHGGPLHFRKEHRCPECIAEQEAAERVAADQTPATPIAGAMALADLLANFLDGDERGWAAEFDFLRREHAEHIEQLATSIREDGITTPILLGNDGRVWDGHHRLCVADALGLVRVPVIQTPATDSEREKVFPDDYGWADLMTLIDHHWPTDVFPVAPDSADRDTGPRLLSLVRRLAEQAATIERVRAVHVEDLFRGHLSNGCKTCSGGEWPCETATALGSQRTEGQG